MHQNRQNVSSAIDVLTNLFYVHKDSYLGIRTLEFYVEIGLFQDARLVAEVIEEKRAYDLVIVMKSLAIPFAEQIEEILKGVQIPR
ncbi:hypothetical protein COE51_21340 [Bacillus pseudomycoides]|nr:hypothetical protein COE51_21340 [Bacillus pseudomycoides]